MYCMVFRRNKIFQMPGRVVTVRMIFVLIVWMLGVCIQSAAETEIKKVVVLFPEGGWATPANQMIYSGLKKGFNEYSKETITLYANNLDLSRFPGANQRLYLAEFYRSRYAGEKIDLVIPVYREALDFVLENRDVVFPGVPIVFCGHFVSEISILDRKDDLTGVAATLDIAETIDLARKLHPGLKRIAVIAGTIESDQYLVTLARQAFKDYQGNLEWLDLTGLPMNDLLEKISLLPESTAILYLSIYRDGAGKRFLPAEALKQISSAANAPVYNIFDSDLGYGSLGGYMLRFEEYGNKTAKIALRIISGEKSGAIEPVVIRDNPAIFDWREMRRWGIAEKNLPPGSIVRYKQYTAWHRYKWWIMGFIAFSCLETLLIVTLLATRRKRRQIGKELRDSEFRYRTVADFTYDWEYWQSPDGTFRYISPSCKRITGYDRDAFADDPFLLRQIILPEYRDTWDLHHLDSHEETGKDKIQFRIKRLDGAVRWIEHVCQPVWGEDGTFLGLRGGNRDITDRKHAEISLQNNKDRFEILSGITHQLLSSDKPQQIINKLCWKIMNHLDCEVFFNFLIDEEKECLYMNTYSGIPEKEAKKIEWLDYGVAVCGTVARDGARIIAENIAETPDPLTELIHSFGIKAYACHPLIAEGKVIGTLSFGTRTRICFTEEELELMKTVTDQVAIAIARKNALDALAISEANLKRAHEVAIIGSWGINIANNEINWSDGVYQIFGLSPGTPITFEKFLELVHPDDQDYVNSKWEAALQMEPFDIEHRIIVDGNAKWVREKAEVEFSNDNKPIRGIGVVQDITRRKLSEIDTFRLRQELAHASRVATMGELAATLAHEINQPLTAILTNTQAARRLLEKGDPDLQEVREVLDDIVKDDKRAQEVIQHLRIQLQKEGSEKGELNINEIVEEVVSFLQRESFERNAHIQLDLDSRILPVHGDRTQIQQVIINLILNAMEAMSGQDEIPHTINIQTRRGDAGNATVSVIDNGIGIDKEKAKNLFEPFYTTKEQGLGLGLSISRSIVEAHGGTMSAMPNRERGSMFSFSLPAEQKEV